MRRLSLLAALSLLAMLVFSPSAFAQNESNDLDCADFDTQEEAQAVYDQDTSDPNGLDGTDNDGLACESLPSGAAEDGTMMGTNTGTGSGNGGTTADLDCADFATQDEAQANLNANLNDPNGLDADNDGLACEDFGYTTNGGTTGGGGTTADLDCVQFATQQEAQANLNANPSDPNGLDADGDGIACETTTFSANLIEFEDGTVIGGGNDTPNATSNGGNTAGNAGGQTTGGNMTQLPDTGGPALLLPVAGLALAGLGALGLGVSRRKRS